MKRLIFLFLFFPTILFAQKKPLDHTVYDGWQSIGERMISRDGKWVVYTVTPQEGDAILYVKQPGTNYVQQIARGYNAVITEDSKFVVFKIKAPYKDTREARIKKKRPEDLPKDSIGILELGKDKVVRAARVKSFKTPEKASGWLAYQKERDVFPARAANAPTQKTVDSLKKTIDSLVMLVTQIKNVKAGSRDAADADDDPATAAPSNEGSDLVVRKLSDGKEKLFKNVVDYAFNAYGQKLVMRVSNSPRDSFSANAVILYDLNKGVLDTILKGGNDFRNFAFTENGDRLAFVAERDTNTKALLKFYGLYLYRNGDDSAHLLADKKSVGMDLGMTISENGNIGFSKTGNRLFFGTVPIPTPKDTTLVDIDLVKLDIWNYKDDYLQTQQLFQLNNELKRSYLAVYDFKKNNLLQLGNPGLQNVIQTNEGDGTWFVAVTDTGRRVQSQWAGNTKKDIYAINVETGVRVLVKKNHDGNFYPSSTGKYILLYDNKARNYFVWEEKAKGLRNITAGIKYPLYDEENDVPDDPNPYGIMGWQEGDSLVYVYDRYNVWAVDPQGMKKPSAVFAGPRGTISYRQLRVDPDERFIKWGQPVFFRAFDEKTKRSGIISYTPGNMQSMNTIAGMSDHAFNTFLKAKNNMSFVYSKENYTTSPDLYYASAEVAAHSSAASSPGGELNAERLSSINPQQASYNWGTAELYQWKAFNGKPATGILYRPEDFDSTKKYPMIIYFYEKLSDNLNFYQAPAPTPSRLNIPFFVSRGYLVFTPDISYTKGQPGKDAYNYIVSGAQALSKKKWVDAKNIGIQGQSWGGYQVAYLVTATNMFKAAWAGAPVVNMFSAYGGIRWESGNNRQFQYEKGQSRIGATPWDRPDLYIANSPFFHLKNVTTPLVIMSNDADGAVPWYQGIEFFTAMRRLNKKVWLLNYNGEAHNLVERRNRKDISIREQEYFDWMLKGAKPAKWLTEGVPAVRKGKDWGLELVDEKE
jgi:dipeptidyl aminopeptidase/acylaminoacyl peptidase